MDATVHLSAMRPRQACPAVEQLPLWQSAHFRLKPAAASAGRPFQDKIPVIWLSRAVDFRSLEVPPVRAAGPHGSILNHFLLRSENPSKTP